MKGQPVLKATVTAQLDRGKGGKSRLQYLQGSREGEGGRELEVKGQRSQPSNGNRKRGRMSVNKGRHNCVLKMLCKYKVC